MLRLENQGEARRRTQEQAIHQGPAKELDEDEGGLEGFQAWAAFGLRRRAWSARQSSSKVFISSKVTPP